MLTVAIWNCTMQSAMNIFILAFQCLDDWFINFRSIKQDLMWVFNCSNVNWEMEEKTEREKVNARRISSRKRFQRTYILMFTNTCTIVYIWRAKNNNIQPTFIPLCVLSIPMINRETNRNLSRFWAIFVFWFSSKHFITSLRQSIPKCQNEMLICTLILVQCPFC